MTIPKLSLKNVLGLGVAGGLLGVALLLLLPASGCLQHCGTCLGGGYCVGELADAATCPSKNGACALVEKCMCVAGGCPGVSGGCSATSEGSCNALPGCAWVSVCNLVYSCRQFDNKDSCAAQSACYWDPSNGCD
jgi:hypothetical protein